MVAVRRLSNDESDGQGKQRSHHDVEDSQSAAAVEHVLDGSAEREPYEATRQRRENEERAEGGGLHDRAARAAAQKGAGGARAHEPGFRIDPLKDRSAHVTHRVPSRGGFDAAFGRRDLL